MKIIMLLLGIFLTGVLLFACVPRETPHSAPSALAPALGEKVIAKEGWEAEWERTLKAAQKEGKVVVYGGSTAAALKMHATKLIKDKFGFELEAVTGSGSEITAKIMTERGNGLFIPDVYASGPGAIYDLLKPKNAVEPLEPALIHPEVVDPKGWFGEKLPWRDKDHINFVWAGHPQIQIAVNTSLAQPKEIKTFKDLLDSRWKGKIVMNDPTVGSGMGFYSWNALLYNKIVDLDFFRQLVSQQQPTVLRDQHLQIQWLARGKFPVALWPSVGRMAEYFEAGAPLAWVMTEEGTYLSGGGAAVALMNKAPHPNAAKIFINWLFSKEGQLLLQNKTQKQSMRVDIPTDELDPLKVRKPGVKYYIDPNDNEEFVLKEYPRYLEWVQEIFRPVIGR